MHPLPSRTLLEQILSEGDYTFSEWCERFNELAEALDEDVRLSPRQLRRFAVGMVVQARPGTRRVAARLWGHPFDALVGRPKTGVATAT